jgi:hypothetical protein
MLRSFTSLTALALIVAPVTLPLTMMTAQAQTPAPKTSTAQPSIQVPTEVTNISGLERRLAGGHKAKVSYRVNLPEGFKLVRIEGDISFKLSDGKFQKGTYSANTNKTSDTVEIAANGEILGVDQEPVQVTAKIVAIAEKVVSGKTTANFKIDGSLLTKQVQPGELEIDIPKISDFKRQALGGHQVRVHYKVTKTPGGFDATKLLVTGSFRLSDNKVQTNSVTRNNPAQAGNELIDTNGQVVKREGETTRIDTKVEIEGKLNARGSGSRTETCGGGECKR